MSEERFKVQWEDEHDGCSLIDTMTGEEVWFDGRMEPEDALLSRDLGEFVEWMNLLAREAAELRAELAAGVKLMDEATEWACDAHHVATVCRACGAIWSAHRPDCALVAAEEWADKHREVMPGGGA